MSASHVDSVSLADIRAVLPEGSVREADSGDAVDGVQPRWIAEPATISEAAALLGLCHRARLAVAPRGSGTKMAWGNPPSRLDLILSMARMNRVLEYSAGDLVVRAEAGTRLEDLQHHVAGAGQRLALDPPESAATLGGIVAANASGPLRLRYGTMRDLLIGVKYILADGTVARAGGKVVKNVAGYDLNKLFTGSLGTLGLLVELIFRLHPIPRAHRIVTVEVSSPGVLGDVVQKVLHSQIVPSALEFRWVDGEGTVACLIEGVEPGVEAQSQRAVELLRSYGNAGILDEDCGHVTWARVTEPAWYHSMSVGLKVTHPVGDLEDVVSSILAEANERSLGIRLGGRAGSGVTLVGVDGDQGALIEFITSVRRAAIRRGGAAVLVQSDPDIKHTVDVWGEMDEVLPLMRRVKTQFDPGNILNPGRFVGGI